MTDILSLMAEQLCMPLSRIAALSPDERLREAYARCGRLRERMSFDRAAGEPGLAAPAEAKWSRL